MIFVKIDVRIQILYFLVSWLRNHSFCIFMRYEMFQGKFVKKQDIMANYEKNMMCKQQLRKTNKTARKHIIPRTFLNPCKTMRTHDFHANIANTRNVASSSIQPVFEKGCPGAVGAEWCFCGHQKVSSWGDVGRGVRARTPVTRFFISSRVCVHAMSAVSFRKGQQVVRVLYSICSHS